MLLLSAMLVFTPKRGILFIRKMTPPYSKINCESGVEECKEDLYTRETNVIGRVDEEV